MGTLLSVAVMVLIVYLLIKLLSGKTQKEEALPINNNSTFEIPDVPDGYRVYEFEDDDDEFFVHGVHHRKKAVLEWAQGKNLKLYTRREASNKYDSNAIAIQGESSGKKKKIGYVAAEIAEDLVDKGFDRKLKLQLLDVKITDDVEPDSDFDMHILIKYKILIPSK